MWLPEYGDCVIAEFSASEKVTAIKFMNGYQENQEFSIECSADGQTWRYIGEHKATNIYRWDMYSVNFTCRYIRVQSQSEYLGIMEMYFLDRDRVVTLITNPSPLFDEQNLYIENPSFMHQAYSDEFLYAEAAFQLLHTAYHVPGKEINKTMTPVNPSEFEWTHPPLGKEIIAAGEWLFGTTPFGWRFSGAIMGILMLPLIYLMAKKMFGGIWWPIFATLLLSSEFMHFTQTRFGTIDSYTVLFIIFIYFFMFFFYMDDPDKTSVKKLWLLLFISGVFLGLGASVKWESLYAAPGILIMFFSTWRKQNRLVMTTVVMCFLFFIIIPFSIYSLTYIPFLKLTNDGFVGLMKNQFEMYWYHTNIGEIPDFGSRWWQWIYNVKPLLYYSTESGGINQSILMLGNPLITIAGFLAVVLLIIDCIYGLFLYDESKAQRRKISFFLAVAYLSQLLPWILVKRTTFLYHYFPNIPFLILALVHVFKNYLYREKPISIVFAVAAILMFIIFYPFISGYPYSSGYEMFLSPILRLISFNHFPASG